MPVTVSAIEITAITKIASTAPGNPRRNTTSNSVGKMKNVNGSLSCVKTSASRSQAQSKYPASASTDRAAKKEKSRPQQNEHQRSHGRHAPRIAQVPRPEDVHHGPASTNSSVHEAPSALVTAVAHTTETPRKPSRGLRFERPNGLPNHFRHTTVDSMTSTEFATDTPIASRSGPHTRPPPVYLAQTRSEVIQPNTARLCGDNRKQHPIREPYRRDAFRLPRKDDAQPGKK